MPTNENVIRVIECIRNDTQISEKSFSRLVYIAIRDGNDHIALDAIRKMIPVAAKQISLDLSPEEQEEVEQHSRACSQDTTERRMGKDS